MMSKRLHYYNLKSLKKDLQIVKLAAHLLMQQLTKLHSWVMNQNLGLAT